MDDNHHFGYLINKKTIVGSEMVHSGPHKMKVCGTVALPFTFKSILRQNKNYGNSNISPCKSIVFQKNPLAQKKPNSFKIL
jgi:hypothetical protein